MFTLYYTALRTSSSRNVPHASLSTVCMTSRCMHTTACRGLYTPVYAVGTSWRKIFHLRNFECHVHEANLLILPSDEHQQELRPEAKAAYFQRSAMERIPCRTALQRLQHAFVNIVTCTAYLCSRHRTQYRCQTFHLQGRGAFSVRSTALHFSAVCQRDLSVSPSFAGIAETLISTWPRPNPHKYRNTPDMSRSSELLTATTFVMPRPC